jgi:hypothetical protein
VHAVYLGSEQTRIFGAGGVEVGASRRELRPRSEGEGSSESGKGYALFLEDRGRGGLD